MTISALGDLNPKNDDLEFSSAEKRRFRKKMALKTEFEAYWMIFKKTTMSDLGDLHTQNDDLEFCSAEKRKFRKKYP